MAGQKAYDEFVNGVTNVDSVICCMEIIWIIG